MSRGPESPCGPQPKWKKTPTNISLGAHHCSLSMGPRGSCYACVSNYICANVLSLGNVLFNDALNTFYLRLYGVRHMVKDHSDSERGNPLPPHGLLFPISSKGFVYAPSHRHDSTYHNLCYTSHGALAGTRKSWMGPPHEGSIGPRANALTTELHLAPNNDIWIHYKCEIIELCTQTLCIASIYLQLFI